MGVPKQKPDDRVMMVPTFNGATVNFPAYLINRDQIDRFKELHDNQRPGLTWFVLTDLIDLTGPIQKLRLPRT